MRTCTFPGCSKPYVALGLCRGHYTQRARGRALQPLRNGPLEARLLARIEFDTNGWGCWLWTGSLDTHGYGHLWFNDALHLTHRAAWKVWRGELPPDKPYVCHRCDIRPCIRPDHLFVATHAENMADMATKGRHKSVPHPSLT